MSPRDDLLPGSASPLERELARLSASLEDIDPSVIEGIWDAWRCPDALLPWLAYALSVDVWDEGWDELRKRRQIADSPAYHRVKGTRASIESVLALAQRPFEITEWFETIPAARRGTARIFVETALADINSILRDIRPLVMTSKPKSRAVYFGAGEMAVAPLTIGAGLLDETLTTIDPYRYLGEDADAGLTIGAGLLDESLTTLEAA